jgi:hypothetical protein
MLLQVVTISSASSAAYSSMLQHMAAVSLIGMDTESSWLGNGSVTVVLSFMVPAVAPSDSGAIVITFLTIFFIMKHSKHWRCSAS